MTSLTNIIEDALKKDSDAEFSFNCNHNFNKSFSAEIDTSAPPQMPEEERRTDITLSDRQQLESVENNEATKATEHPVGSISTQAETPPEVQTPNSIIPQQNDPLFEVKAATSMLNTKNSYIDAVKKDRENTLKYNDNIQIQQIQNNLLNRQLKPIAEDIGVKSELPPDVLPAEWMAFLSCLSNYLNVPLIALVSGLLASICIATLGRFKIEVEKDRYYEAFTFYFIVVMLSGAMKSAIVQLFKGVFDKHLKELQTEHDAKAPDPKMIKQLYEKSRKKLVGELSAEVLPNDIAEINRQLSNIKGILAPLKEKMENSCARPKFFDDSPTPKKLGENMAQQKGVTAILDAESGILKHRIRANENVLLLKSFTMESYASETSTNGSVILQNPCLTICSYVQPGAAFKLYSKKDFKDDGLLPRILPVFCLYKQGLQNMIAQEIDPKLMAMYEAKITNILEYCLEERKYDQEN